MLLCGGQGRNPNTTLTVDDLTFALAEQGVHVARPAYYT
jgi:hypothetical protein